MKVRPFFIADSWKLVAGMSFFSQLSPDKLSPSIFHYSHIHPENLLYSTFPQLFFSNSEMSDSEKFS